MTTERIAASDLTQPLTRPDPDASAEQDPLAKITVTPRALAAVLAAAALLVGLVLAIVPVRVAGPDPVNPTKVSCGNTLGGVETGRMAGSLPKPTDQPTVVSYVDMCERAVSNRVFYSWPLFFGGGLGIIWLGVVRRT
jgi:hypothetical protein